MLKLILLVEDNPNDLGLTLLTLERGQLTNDVVVTRNGAKTLDYLRTRSLYVQCMLGNPAVVLLDLKLPKADGLEVLTEIRAAPVLKSLPMVMLTSSCEETDPPRSYELDVSVHVVKLMEFRAPVDTITDLGVFWMVPNEPPPDSTRVHRTLLPAS